MSNARRALALSSFAVLVAGFASAAAGSPTTDRANPRCPTAGTTVVRNSDARIWRITGKSEPHRYYGCVYEVGRILRLDPPHGQLIETKKKVKLAGMIAAYEMMDFGAGPFRVVVRSLRSGTTIHRATSNAAGSTDGHTGPVDKIVLKRTGSVAWTASVDCVCEGVDYSTGFEVDKIDRDNRRVVLDRGPAVDPLSLVLVAPGRRIEWKHDRETRSAALD